MKGHVQWSSLVNYVVIPAKLYVKTDGYNFVRVPLTQLRSDDREVR